MPMHSNISFALLAGAGCLRRPAPQLIRYAVLADGEGAL